MPKKLDSDSTTNQEISLDRDLNISFLGPEGSYSDEAVNRKFGGHVNKKSSETIEGVFQRVGDKISDYGIVPIENSSEGTVNITLDCLSSSSLKICGELELKINHNLLGINKEIPKESFEIQAHEQTLAQCRIWLDTHYPNVKRIPVSSNAQAAANAKRSEKIYAIAGVLAAERYDLDILKSNIQDYEENTTRFITIGHDEVEQSGKDKTSIVITTKNTPGALYNVLKPINKEGLNLTHLTYRPSKTDKWNYSFFLDFEGHKNDKNVRTLLDNLDKIGEKLKILGSYPQAVE